MAGNKLLNLGFGNSVAAHRVLAIVNPSSAPIKRMREEARLAGRLIDATQGRRTRSVVITDSGHVVLSAIQTDTISQRYEQTRFPTSTVSLDLKEAGDE